MDRRERIEELLRTYNEAKEAGAYSSHGPAGDGAGVPLMALVWHQGSYQELHDLMSGRMREERPKQYRHVCARYLHAVRRVKSVKRRGAHVLNLDANEAIIGGEIGAKGKGKAILVESDMVVERWEPWVRRHIVHAGVSWLSVKLPCDPQLPTEWLKAA